MFKNSYLIYCAVIGLTLFVSACEKEKKDDKVVIPENVTYTNTVSNILKTNGCEGCHGTGGTLPELNSYDKAKTNINAIIGSVSHAVGFSPMPKNTPKISATQIKAIEDWKAQGLLN